MYNNNHMYNMYMLCTWHTHAATSIRIPHVHWRACMQVLLAHLKEHLAASAGAACHSESASISAVLRAMGVPTEYAVGTLRLSTGRHTTIEEVDRAAELIVREVQREWAQAKQQV